MEGVAQRLRDARKKRGMTQIELAEAVGLRQGTISFIEVGKTTEPSNILKIAKVLKVDPYWLLSGDSPKPAGLKMDDLKFIISHTFEAIQKTDLELTPDLLADIVCDVVDIGREFLGDKPWTEETLYMAVGTCLRQHTE